MSKETRIRTLMQKSKAAVSKRKNIIKKYSKMIFKFPKHKDIEIWKRFVNNGTKRV